jgi:hypothetical protein
MCILWIIYVIVELNIALGGGVGGFGKETKDAEVTIHSLLTFLFQICLSDFEESLSQHRL